MTDSKYPARSLETLLDYDTPFRATMRIFEGTRGDQVILVVGRYTFLEHIEYLMGSSNDIEWAEARFNLLPAPWFPAVIESTVAEAVEALTLKLSKLTDVEFNSLPSLFSICKRLAEEDKVPSYDEVGEDEAPTMADWLKQYAEYANYDL
jgi:hypothetical protein